MFDNSPTEYNLLFDMRAQTNLISVYIYKSSPTVDEYFKTGLLRPGRSRYYYYYHRRASDISYNSRAIYYFIRVWRTHTHIMYRPHRMCEIRRLSHTIVRIIIIICDIIILSGPIYGAEQRCRHSDAII